MAELEIRRAISLLNDELVKDFEAFCCGDEDYHRDLDEFITLQAADHGGKRMNKTYLCHAAYGNDNEAHPVGFFSVSASHILKSDLPEGSGRRNFPYKTIPALLIGRFAVDKGHKRLGHGRVMMKAIRDMADRLEIGCRFLALHVEATNEDAIRFYEGEGFIFAQDVPSEDTERLMLYDLIAS